MAAAVEGRDDESSPSSSATSSSVASSSNDRLKFLCSYGGRILPRPTDGRLKYVGGDTRVLAVRRSITFSELKEKIHAMFQRSGVIKYQLAAEDLDDALISVTCDEDLAYMLDEYDRLDSLHPRSPSAASSPLFRLFLFGSHSRANSPVHSNEQRYVDGASLRSPVYSTPATPTCVNPPSYFDCPAAGFAPYPHLPTGGGGDGWMHRVRTTPNLRRVGIPRVHSTPNLGAGGGGGRGLPSQQHRHLRHPPLQNHRQYRKQSSATPTAAAIGGGVARNEMYWERCVLCASQQVKAGLHGSGVCVGLGGHAEELSSGYRPPRCCFPTRYGVPSRSAFIWEQ